MKININFNDNEKVNAALAAVNARVRNVNHDSVVKMVMRIEKDLNRKGLLKKYWTGLKFRCNPHARIFQNACKGVPMATYFTVERYPSGWYLVGVERSECKTDFVSIVSELSEEQKQCVLDVFCKF